MKTRKLFAIALTAGLFLGAGACGGNADGQSAAENTFYEFSFASGLPENRKIIPEWGRERYITFQRKEMTTTMV